MLLTARLLTRPTTSTTATGAIKIIIFQDKIIRSNARFALLLGRRRLLTEPGFLVFVFLVSVILAPGLDRRLGFAGGGLPGFGCTRCFHLLGCRCCSDIGTVIRLSAVLSRRFGRRLDVLARRGRVFTRNFVSFDGRLWLLLDCRLGRWRLLLHIVNGNRLGFFHRLLGFQLAAFNIGALLAHFHVHRLATALTR